MNSGSSPSRLEMATTPASGRSQPAVDDAAEAEAIVRRSGTSFFWAMRMQPDHKRRAMFAIYAYCREVDDIADEPAEAASKTARLGAWQHEIDRLFEGAPRQPVARALLEPVAMFGLRKADFEAILRGMEMDAADAVRIADRGELDLYCDRVACAVGRLSVRVFGVPDSEGKALANALGRALQLTNILRDLHEDAQRDRLYLPADMLHAHDISETADASAVLRAPRLPEVCETLAETARACFSEAAERLGRCDRRSVRPATVMMEVYRRQLTRVVARGWHRLEVPVSLSQPEKLWIAVRHGVL